ncbi:alpha-1,6-glucosidase domain-containing protein [Cryptosporangium japonicum]|uniref:Glycosyl hydrolase family 13 catalytic domain-containing protein n=1 Tax=Cryptosporangium japonicum TaxID=80872 RepID=A0ABN0UUS9_9ACTN
MDVDLTRAAARWISADRIVWRPADRVRLHTAPRGGLAVTGGRVTGGTAVDLLPGLRVPDLPVRELLTGQLVVAAYDADDELVDATGVQIAGVLDDLYAGAATRTLGPVWRDGVPTLALWAPTATDVVLWMEDGTRPMRRDGDGVWTVTGEPGWKDRDYLFEVEVFVPETGRVERNRVTDPYSIGLAVNSTRSRLVDLGGWTGVPSPPGPDQAIYELHVRDFSIGDASVPAEHRGTYRAFTHPDSVGMTHLARLARAGLTTVHLLPVADFSSVDDVRTTGPGDLTGFAPDSDAQQERVTAVADDDGFNWGYDPLHWTVPEGSYAVDPDARTDEVRAMVDALHRVGLRVVLDVVYNHTASAGQAGTNSLDRIVPGYYHRLDDAGAVYTSTCCPNTATEHTMAGKLLIDSVLTWARGYGVDGFRFDLMGHHPRALMVELRERYDGLLYGEGWDFGEVAGNALFVNASQANMVGTGISTFDDSLRDAARGGSPFDDDPRVQGFASGLGTDPNGVSPWSRDQLYALQDRIQGGLTNPDAVTYVDAHDNLTLYDALTYKLPPTTSMADRIRMNTVALALTAFGRGLTFWHAGVESLRSKSFDADSYNSGDWFNVYDPTGRTHGFGRGLPPAAKNAEWWKYARPLLADASLRPTAADVEAATASAETLLRLRASTPLFGRPGTGTVSFPASAPGVIVMMIDDRAGSTGTALVVVFNATPFPTTQFVPAAAGAEFALHPVQAAGPDPVVRTASFVAGSGAFTVPARTAAVFVADAGRRS